MNNRELKFKVWLLGIGKMMEGTYTITDLMKRFGDLVIFDDAQTFLQYTGKKDMNGKEIYEGDIVRVYEEARVVEFKNAFWQLELHDAAHTLGGFGTAMEAGHKPLYRYPQDWIEIIGNIYEHPNLIQS
jgi:uncharacterized phage protein (TIGR01671 family)